MRAAWRTYSHFTRLLRKGRVPVMVGLAAVMFWLPHLSFLRPLQAYQKFLEFLEKREYNLHDMRFLWRGPTPPNPQIAIVGINQTSQERSSFKESDLASSEALRLMTEHRYPWNRKVWALLIEKLSAAGARAIVFDLIFNPEMDGDPELRTALEKHSDKVTLAFTFQDEANNEGLDTKVLLGPNPRILPAPPTDIKAAALYNTDTDGVIRRTSYRAPMGYFADTPAITLAGRAYEILTGKSVPDGEFPINFQGRARTYPRLPVEEIFIDSVFEKDPKFAGGKALKDKVVFVGPLAEIFHDEHSTPFGVMPGVEIHAQALGDLLSSTSLRTSSGRADWWTNLAMVAIPALTVLLVRQALAQTGLLLGLGIGFFVTAQMLFTEFHLVIPMVLPLLGLVTVGSFGVVYHFVIEQLERSRIRSVLNQYVSKNVAKVVMAQSDRFEESLRGVRKPVTALFSDLRGFTSIFESADAEQLVAQLNEYFQEMVDAVEHEDGTIQKFIGDAIMAVWGDTHTRGLAGDAARAVRTALQMRERLVRLNAAWATRPDRVQLRFGIGINHGEVIVGEVGCVQRKEFTALGDAVNSASRLEGATKAFHCEILVGERVEELTRSEFVYRRVDRLRLKGKQLPVEVYIPLSTATTPPPPWLEDYHKAIGLYRSRQFPEAASSFAEINARLGAEDYLCQMYINRCQEYCQTPPAPDWDGGHTLTEK